MKYPLPFTGRYIIIHPSMEHAGMMELVDVTDSKSVELITRVGSSPTAGTEKEASMRRLLFIG